MEVLGSSAVSIASQTTRLGKGSSVTTRDEHAVRVAGLQAKIKPTALCSVFDKENSIEFPLDSVHYLYMKSNPNPSFYPALPYESCHKSTRL